MPSKNVLTPSFCLEAPGHLTLVYKRFKMTTAQFSKGFTGNCFSILHRIQITAKYDECLVLFERCEFYGSKLKPDETLLLFLLIINQFIFAIWTFLWAPWEVCLDILKSCTEKKGKQR